MRKILDIQKQLVPDMLRILNKRYTILHQIRISGTIGRRTLAGSLDMTERVLRGEVDFMKAQGLIQIETSGMRISEEGTKVLDELEPMMKDILGLTHMEQQICEKFRIKQAVIVPGDSDTSSFTRKELGRAGASVLRKYLSDNDIIAVTGGSTMAEVANHLLASGNMKNSCFVPARGGLGESMEFQANTIASNMAKKTGAQYRLLHVPDHLNEEAYQSLMKDPNIQERMQVIRESRIVVHGIGDAMVMARRRKVDQETIKNLQKDGALAEAFGYYFNKDGEVVHKMSTVGLRLEDIQNTEIVIGIAGGESKGEAIASVLKFGHQDVLVTDEAAAIQLMHDVLS
ncbi:sugar-binding domain-containing protein [Paenibacillus larvae]